MDNSHQRSSYQNGRVAHCSRLSRTASTRTIAKGWSQVQKEDAHKGQKQKTTLVLSCDSTVWSEGNPLMNIFFRFDELGCGESSAATKQKARCKEKQRLGSDLMH